MKFLRYLMGMKILVKICFFHSRQIVELEDINKEPVQIGYQEVHVLTEDNN